MAWVGKGGCGGVDRVHLASTKLIASGMGVFEVMSVFEFVKDIKSLKDVNAFFYGLLGRLYKCV